VSYFASLSIAAWLLVVVLGATLRSRAYAVFRGVTLGLQVLFALAIVHRFEGPWFWGFAYLHAMGFVSALFLIRPRLRSVAYRALVSVPAAFFSAGTLLSLPWVLARIVGFDLPGIFVPYAVALIGVVQSLTTRVETREIALASDPETDAEQSFVSRVRRNQGIVTTRVPRPLTLVQITDPHLGPFMSVERLKGICARAVERKPDLILLTGDFLTMESHARPEWLAEALSPLAALPGRVFACFGNHDHEAPATVRHALEHAGVKLLIDEAALVPTDAGLVEIIGFDFVWRDRERHLARVCSAYPRTKGALRLALLHDPSAFRHLPPGQTDLVLSGHTHGGQVGFVSLGLPYTLMRLFTPSPDHGLWGRGGDRLYVHRGTGHYGFPLRLGVPAEESLLAIHAQILIGEAPAE
jgi:predicted MPP superfamily phosphohydrolase